MKKTATKTAENVTSADLKEHRDWLRQRPHTNEWLMLLRENTERVTQILDGMPRSKSKERSTLESRLVKYLDERAKIMLHNQEMIELGAVLEEALARRPIGERSKLLLEYRYIYAWTWGRIGRMMNLMERQLMRENRRSLKRFDEHAKPSKPSESVSISSAQDRDCNAV